MKKSFSPLARGFLCAAVLPFSIFFMAGCQENTASALPPQQSQPQAQESTPAPIPVSPLAIPVLVNGRYAVIDGNGKLRIPFENEFVHLFHADYRDVVLAWGEGGWSFIQADGKNIIKADLSKMINALTPGYFSFEENGKLGVSDSQGNVIQPPRYDEVYFLGDHEFILYELDGKRGLMDAKGAPITEAVYDEIDDPSSYAGYGGLIMAKRGAENWLINARAGTQEKAPYSKIYASREDAVYRRAVDEQGKEGLVDAAGKLVIPLNYAVLGEAAEGLVSFQEAHGGPCGYLDLQGKVVIEAKYSDCTPFGKKGAFVRGKDDAETGAVGQYGLLDRQGAWVIEPKYTRASEAGASRSGWGAYVPGITAISVGELFSESYGLFDTDKGEEIVAPKYALINVLTDRILGFSTAESPKISVSEQALPAIGLMDYTGKALLQPEGFSHIALDASGKFLLAVAQGKQALIGLDGRQLIAPEWSKLEVNTTLNVVFAYEKWRDPESDDSIDVLRAAYDFNGKPLFAIRKTPCGAEVLQNGKGETLWPQDAAPYCAEK